MKHLFPILLFATAVALPPSSAQPAPAESAALPDVASLEFPPLPQVKIPDITTFTLPNGMRVYLLENHELPLIGGGATIRTGNLFEPPDKVGLAGITGTVMRTGGTSAKTGDELDETLENMAASVEASIGETSGSVSFSALAENTDQVLEIFKAVLTDPAFREDKLELAKTQTKSAISRRNDNAGAIAGREFASIVYGRDNPYGWEVTYDHINNIQRDDLVDFYQRYFFPENVMLAIYGDFSTKDMRARLEKLFADWTVKKPAVPPFPAVTPQKDAPGIYHATKSEVTQAFFNLGHLGGVLKDKDYPALSVMSDILGGGFSSRLFTNVRTKLGLAYNISGGWGANYGHPGLFRVGGSTKSESTVETLQAAKVEIERIRTAEVTDQELETAKQSVLNSFVFFFDHPRKTLNRYVTYEYWGYPRDFIFQYQKAVEATTKADVLRVAKENLHPDRLTVVAVGNPKDYGKPLSTLGEVKELDISIPEPTRQESKADATTLARGKELLQRMQQALGGADRLASVKDATFVADVSVSTPGGTMKIRQTSEWIAPDIQRTTQEMPFGKMIVFWDGKSGWVSNPKGTADLPEPIARQVRGEAFRNFFRVFLADRDPSRTVNAVGENTIEVSNQGGERVRIEIDPKTGLPAKMMYESITMQGAPGAVTANYTGWTEVEGIQLPKTAVIEQNGEKFAEVTYVEAKINSGLSAEALGQKP